jgi:hypothetical protein
MTAPVTRVALTQGSVRRAWGRAQRPLVAAIAPLRRSRPTGGMSAAVTPARPASREVRNTGNGVHPNTLDRDARRWQRLDQR